MKIVDIADATASLAAYAKKVGKGPLVVTNRGKPIAAIIEIKNADLETVTLSMDPDFLALIKRSRDRARNEGTISADEIRRRLIPSGPGRAKKKRK